MQLVIISLGSEGQTQPFDSPLDPIYPEKAGLASDSSIFSVIALVLSCKARHRLTPYGASPPSTFSRSPLHRRNPMVPHNRGRLTSSSSRRDVLYCCGRCGYALNLSSSDRDTANIGAEYGKTIRKGVVSFAAIDESRFTHADELLCLPFFRSPRSWGLRRRRTRLLCRGCGHLIGTYDNDSDAVSSPSGGSSSESNDAENASGSFRRYKIRIDTLQPSDDDDAGAPFFT